VAFLTLHPNERTGAWGAAPLPKAGLRPATFSNMKHAGFKAHPGKGGWVQTTISPIHDKREARFGAMDIVMFIALIAVTIGVARFLLAH
jgi:hypothetical protein